MASRSPKSKHALCLLALHFLCIYANQWPLAMFGKLPRFRVLQLCGLPFHASHNGRSRTGADLWAFASEPDKLPDRVNFANLVADYLVNICILVICTRMPDKTPGATYISIEGNDLSFQDKKHCQRHNGPKGWVHITISYTNLDQISSSKSRTGINFKISTKCEHLE